jgi:ABC-type transport system involved in multi-copper enzyme maturation permease subunit
MSLLKNELCKLLSKKAAWILLLLILVNPLALIYIINTPSEEGYTIKEYSSVYRKINGLNENSALEKIENCLNETESYGMMNLYTRVYSEVEGVFSYGEYLDEIDKKTEDVDIMARFFNNGTYAIENARKTQQAYQKLKGLTIKPVDPSGILCLTDIGITDYILLLIIFILAVSIIFQEKDNNQFKLLRTMKKGRISIMLSKIMVMIISIVAMTVILYGTNYGVARANFGIPDFTTPIQSLYAYRSSPFNLNIGGFLISYIVIKILANILIGMFFLVICAVFDSFIYVFMSGAVLVFVELLLYTKISETHYLAYLKFINIMYGIKTVDMLSDYINLNV